MNKHVISIHEYHGSEPAQGQTCRVWISVDGSPQNGFRSIRDPFSADGRHGRLAWYLEDALYDDTFTQTAANEYADRIDGYRTELSRSLGLRAIAKDFTCSRVDINIFAYSYPHVQDVRRPTFMPILGFYWELLELVSDQVKAGRRAIWPSRIQQVSVRRVVRQCNFSKEHLKSRCVPTNTPWSTVAGVPEPPEKDRQCRVLLVIARKLARPGQYEISPSLIECCLLRLFESLNKAIGRDFYHLEVVRPGSFEELKDHLENPKFDQRPESLGDAITDVSVNLASTAQPGTTINPGSDQMDSSVLVNQSNVSKKPFHVVHFDMHGIVLCPRDDCGLPRSQWRPKRREDSCRKNTDGHLGRACLIFTKMNEVGELTTSAHSASDIAQLLKKHSVHCVALNACESARTNEGEDGNLSYTFLNQGISNVVAMSFRISDSMFVNYYVRFYRQLFESHPDLSRANSFADAASKARLSLQADCERRNAYNDAIDMEDWFVPVTYCNENVIEMPLQPTQVREGFWQKLFRWRPRIVNFGLKAIGWSVFASPWIGTCWMLYRGEKKRCVAGLLFSLFTTPTLLYFANLSGSLLSLHCVKSTTATEIKCGVLDSNMLNIEGELKNCRPLVLHGLSSMPDTLSFIDNLAFAWSKTKFIDLIITVPAAWFYQPEFIRSIRRWCCRISHYAECCYGDSVHHRKNTMVIVTGLEIIFPQDPVTQLNPVQAALQARAQQRFFDFFEKHFKDEEESHRTRALVVTAGGEKPYLFLSGNANLQDTETLRASLDRLKIVGIRSTTYTEAGEWQYYREKFLEELLAKG